MLDMFCILKFWLDSKLSVCANQYSVFIVIIYNAFQFACFYKELNFWYVWMELRCFVLFQPYICIGDDSACWNIPTKIKKKLCRFITGKKC